MPQLSWVHFTLCSDPCTLPTVAYLLPWGKLFTAFKFQGLIFFPIITYTKLYIILLPLANVIFLWNFIAYANYFEIASTTATSIECLLFAMNFSRQLMGLIVTAPTLQNNNLSEFCSHLPNIIQLARNSGGVNSDLPLCLTAFKGQDPFTIPGCNDLILLRDFSLNA